MSKKILTLIAIIIILLFSVNMVFASDNNISDIKYYEQLIENKKIVTILLDKNTVSRKVTKKELMNYDSKIQEIKNESGKILNDTDLVKTGDYIIVNNELYQIILYGDVNKDGYICDIEDIMIIRDNFLGSKDVDELQKIAGNLENKDNTLDIEDIMKMINTYLGQSKTDIISKVPDNYINFNQNNDNTDNKQDEEVKDDTDNKQDEEVKDNTDNKQDEEVKDDTDNKQDEDIKDNNENNTEQGSTPLDIHGELSVEGTSIVDKNGDKFQLKGVSTHGIQWFPQYINKSAFLFMRDEWGINAIRLAMYSDSNAGYTKQLHKLVDEGVQYATDAGLYVIIDWHILSDGNPNTNKEAAIEFFKEMAEKYKDNDNIIYEICNEPNGDVQWDRDIKPYAEEVIKEIRAIDDDAIIIVGTPTWSQDVDVVANNPIKGYENIMYTLHFYAATHKDSLRQKLATALDAGLPIFVTEFGICDASGNGDIDINEANTWIDYLNEHNISWMCWNLSNKDESSALLKNTDKITEWTTDELSEEGKWLLEALKR